MTRRITNQDLELRTQQLNEITDNPAEYGAVGHYYIDYAYGGCALYQIVNEGGGSKDVLNSGHIPKRELFNLMDAFCVGILTAKVQILESVLKRREDGD